MYKPDSNYRKQESGNDIKDLKNNQGTSRIISFIKDKGSMVGFNNRLDIVERELMGKKNKEIIQNVSKEDNTR